MEIGRCEQGFLLDSLMEHSPDAIYFKDLDSRFVMVNKACARKHGWESADGVKGKSDFDLFTREHAEQAYADEQRIVATGEPLLGIEEKETWPDGRTTWASTTKMPLRGGTGEIVGTFGVSRDITPRKEAELRARRYADEMRGIKEELEADVRMAGELQKSFFPSAYPAFPEGAEPGGSCVGFLHRSVARGEVMGDYCAVSRLSATEVGIFLCDIGGAGVRAALGTALIRGVMQEVAGLGRDPAAYLARMNELLHPLLHQEQLLLHATACYLVLDAASGRIRLASAGLPMPILFRKGRGACWLFDNLLPGDPPLAAQPAASYAAAEGRIEPGCSVVLFTDGLYEVVNNMDVPYGKKRLLDSAHSLAGEPLGDVFDGLQGDALAFSRDGRFADDVCLVGFELRSAFSSPASQ